MIASKTHWEKIYSDNAPSEVSWFQDRPTISLRLIESCGVDKNKPIIDVGGGASLLVDCLLESGYSNLSVLDISATATEYAQKRLGTRAEGVHWIEADVTEFKAKQPFSLWHDRAVFHFLVTEEARQKYLESLTKALCPSGHLVIATFAIDGPKKCSGLEIVQYDTKSLEQFFSKDFELKETDSEVHRTPWNSEQKFVYCRFQRR